MRSSTSRRADRGSAVVDFALVAPMVLFVVLALMQLALTLHTRSIIVCAAEDAVRVAASRGGTTAAGEQRLRMLVARDLRSDAITSVLWASTLDTLTLRVRSQLPVFGPLGSVSMTTTASAYREAWA